MTTYRVLVFATVILAATFFIISVAAYGIAAMRIAAAADVNTSSSASGVNAQPANQSAQSSLQVQNASTATDVPTQTSTIPLIPVQLVVANQTVSQQATPSASATPEPSQTAASVSATPTAAASGNSANSVETTTNATQPAADNGSLAPIPPVSIGGVGNGLMLIILSSYATAIVVLALMRYWSVSFNEDAEPSRELNNAASAQLESSAYTTLKISNPGTLSKGRERRHD